VIHEQLAVNHTYINLGNQWALRWYRIPGKINTLAHLFNLSNVSSFQSSTLHGKCGRSGSAARQPRSFPLVVSTGDQKRSSYGPAFSMPDYDHPELKRDDKGATKTARRGC
jgi:hypothetical protein